MDERIVLDERSFKALSADSRIGILRNLTDRRRTLSELSQKMNLGASTVKEHCEILVGAELIKQIDEGRKWKYYELTSKGKKVITPNPLDEVKVLVLLSLGTAVIGGFIFMLLESLAGADFSARAPSIMAKTYSDNLLMSTALNGVSETGTQTVTAQTILPQISFEIFFASVIIAVIAGILIGWYFTRKRV